MLSLLLTWLIAALAVAGVMLRPFNLPEAIWAVAGAVLIVALGLLPVPAALAAVGRGTDVYFFLIGMMLLSEVARREGLFDWLATHVVNLAQGSPRKLFAMIYLSGTVITVFMSNDATAVVLTPAVLAAARKARTEPMPLLFICALVANAASFMLPISNPANLVLYGAHMPPLGRWLADFGLASVVSIVCTYILLRVSQRHALTGQCAAQLPTSTLGAGGWMALAGIVITTVALMGVSIMDRPLGMPTALLGGLTTLCVACGKPRDLWPTVRSISWSVLPLVAGLFVLVAALAHTGVIRLLAQHLHALTAVGVTWSATVCAVVLAFASNLINNLPAGLIASATLQAAHSPQSVVNAALIGVDLGPNLSVTGSLATILWLIVLRREGLNVGLLAFLRVGVWVMTPTLLITLIVRGLTST